MKLPLLKPATVASLIIAFTPALSAQDRRPPERLLGNVGYEVRYDSALAARRSIRVVMSFVPIGSGPLLLSLPAWTPGAYGIRNFARNISGFAATQGGNAIRWEKSDHDTWRIFPGRTARVSVSFDYRAESFDNADSWTRPDFVFFNGTNLFLYPEEGSLQYPAGVEVSAPDGWHIATSMPAGRTRRSYSAPTYHELVDHPFFVGRFDLDSALVAGKWMRLATYPAGSVTGANRTLAWDQLTKVTRNQASIFQDVPWESYTVMQIVDSSLSSGAGLEHADSHVDILAPGFVGTESLGGLYAHEIFHAWNVKRMRPAEMFPYRYDRPQPTTLLWISEGVTDYYADLSSVRTGVISEQRFFAATLSKLADVARNPGIALEDASLSAWIAGAEGGGEIYYSKGSLAGLMLDIMIRDATDNAGSLDDVMRDLYGRSWKRGRGFTADDWWSAVERAAAGKPFSDFNARYVDGREEYPIAEVLKLAGLDLTETVIKAPSLGVSIETDSTGSRVVAIEAEGPAALSGARVGDYVVTLGGISTDAPDAVEQFSRKFVELQAGTPVSIRILRGREVIELNAPLRFATSRFRQIVNATDASAKAQRIRAGLLSGTTRQ